MLKYSVGQQFRGLMGPSRNRIESPDSASCRAKLSPPARLDPRLNSNVSAPGRWLLPALSG